MVVINLRSWCLECLDSFLFRILRLSLMDLKFQRALVRRVPLYGRSFDFNVGRVFLTLGKILFEHPSLKHSIIKLKKKRKDFTVRVTKHIYCHTIFLVFVKKYFLMLMTPV